MKIKVNPILSSQRESLELLNSNFKDVQMMFSRIRDALLKQKTVIVKIEKLQQKQNRNEKELSTLADELDSIVSSCKEGNTVLLCGDLSRALCRISMWIATGIHRNQWERVFLETMTSSALHIRKGTKINADQASTVYARSRIDKVLAAVNAYISRFGYTQDYWKEPLAPSYEKKRLERYVKKHQAGFMLTAGKNMKSTLAVLERIKLLAAEAAGRKPHDCLAIQIEVLALVDEVDRIASNSAYNRFRLLTGEFSQKCAVASLWFLSGEGMLKSERMYLKTCTAFSYGLKDRCGKLLFAPDNSAEFVKMLDESIKSLSFEIERVWKTAAYLEKKDDSLLKESAMESVLTKWK